jgi:hypothetical protein
VSQVGEKVKTRVGEFENVVVIEESKKSANGAQPLKYYARRTGLVHVGWRDKKTEGLDLYEIGHLDADELAKVHDAALKLERHAYETSKDVYGKTHPSEPNPLVRTQETKLRN